MVFPIILKKRNVQYVKKQQQIHQSKIEIWSQKACRESSLQQKEKAWDLLCSG